MERSLGRDGLGTRLGLAEPGVVVLADRVHELIYMFRLERFSVFREAWFHFILFPGGG